MKPGQPETLEEVIIQATQLLPAGWAIEINIERDRVEIACVNPEGQDEPYQMEVESMAQMVYNALSQACYVDMKEHLEVKTDSEFVEQPE